MKIIFATGNKGKIIEMKDILSGLNIEVVSAAEAGITEEIKEDGSTFAENARIKAAYVARKTGLWAVADDSGICIDVLNGEPGVRTARWGNVADLADFTLQKMAGVPPEKRTARFESAAAICSPDGECEIFFGSVNGSLSEQKRGQAVQGLPYDSIFIPEGRKKTFAEMGDKEKNSLSHRGNAFRKLREYLKWLVESEYTNIEGGSK